jgi:hypothetical protein
MDLFRPTAAFAFPMRQFRRVFLAFSSGDNQFLGMSLPHMRMPIIAKIE